MHCAVFHCASYHVCCLELKRHVNIKYEFYFYQIQWFTKYNKSLATYMRTVGLDLTQVKGLNVLPSYFNLTSSQC